MRDNISEIIEELEGYGVPRKVAVSDVLAIFHLGTGTKAERTETLEIIAQLAADKCGPKWPSGRLRA